MKGESMSRQSQIKDDILRDQARKEKAKADYWEAKAEIEHLYLEEQRQWMIEKGSIAGTTTDTISVHSGGD